MTVIEKIQKKARQLPVNFQQEALHFILFLSEKVKKSKKKSERELWSDFSLTQAMKGLEEDTFPEYSVADLKERWK